MNTSINREAAMLPKMKKRIEGLKMAFNHNCILKEASINTAGEVSFLFRKLSTKDNFLFSEDKHFGSIWATQITPDGFSWSWELQEYDYKNLLEGLSPSSKRKMGEVYASLIRFLRDQEGLEPQEKRGLALQRDEDTREFVQMISFPTWGA